jgi:hypothetical protein
MSALTYPSADSSIHFFPIPSSPLCVQESDAAMMVKREAAGGDDNPVYYHLHHNPATAEDLIIRDKPLKKLPTLAKSADLLSSPLQICFSLALHFFPRRSIFLQRFCSYRYLSAEKSGFVRKQLFHSSISLACPFITRFAVRSRFEI